MDLYFLVYNNYYNKTYKREELLVNYLPYRVAEVEDCELWNPGDGVSTSQVLDYESTANVFPDYMIAAIGNEIKSRWFVLDADRLRNGQYRVSLRRDVIADNIENLLTSPMMVERALLPESSNLIYNSENITVNQIKTDETPIKDETKVPWIVGYLNRNYAGGTFSGNMEITPYRTYNSFNDFEYNNYFTEWFKGYTSDESTWFTLYWYKTPFLLNNWIRSWDIRSSSIKQNSDWKSAATVGYMTYINEKQEDFPTLEQVKSTFGANTWIADIRTRFGIKSAQETSNLLTWQNTIIKVGDLYYRITIESEPFVYEESLNKTDASNSANNIRTLCENSLHGSLRETLPSSTVYTFHSSGMRYKLHKEQLYTSAGFSFTIPAQRPALDDAPYDMFAIPYGTYDNTGNKDIAMKTASTLMAKLNVGSTADLYDVQLLPFGPKLSTTTTDIKSADDKLLGKIYWVNESSFSKDIPLDNPIGVPNKKIDHICNRYRLVSPNYSGQFEFTAAANNGISGFTINCTYMPINPYIRVAPIFGGLYGKEFNDARGLICGGDFSLPVVNDAWISYQQNNKNYQAVFDRQIQNLEFTNDINRKMDRINALTGTVSGAASGAMAGSMAGPWGAVIGGAVGGIASGAGGAADVAINESMRKEQRSFTEDLFKLNLGNIQAQPYSLSKTTAFTANNKIFPILEYYTCSKEQKNLVAKHIAQYSMSVGALGELKDYISNTWAYNDIIARRYIKGKFIFINNVPDDWHMLATINEEMQGGVYFNEYTE